MKPEAVGWAALITVLWSVLMMTMLAYPFEHRFNHDVDSPILALELAHDKSDIDAVLQTKRENRAIAVNTIWWNTILDLVFIPLYVGYLLRLGRLFPDVVGLGRLVPMLAAGAGLFDYVEDWLIFMALRGGYPPVYLPSLAKWGLLALTQLALGPLLLRTRVEIYSLATRRLLGLAHVTAGAIMLLGAALGEWIGYSWIELGAKIFAVTILSNAIGLVGGYLGGWLRESQPEPLDDFCSKRSKARPGQ